MGMDGCIRRARHRLVILGMVLVSLGSQRGDEIPEAPTHYRGREIAQTMHFLGAPWLIRQSRQREEDCATMLAELRLRPGMTVCDMGCGNGFYTLPIARAVGPRGVVYAVDIQQVGSLCRLGLGLLVEYRPVAGPEGIGQPTPARRVKPLSYAAHGVSRSQPDGPRAACHGKALPPAGRAGR